MGVQRLAFVKLLKKYKKWTHSEVVERRFRADLDKSGTFSNTDLGVVLGRWTGALQDVRAPFQPGFLGQCPHQSDVPTPNTPRLSISTTQGPSGSITAESSQSILETTSSVDFDSAFAKAQGDCGCRLASYWVHNDNIVELQVLLLQHMRLFHSNSTSPISRSPSTQFRRRSTNTSELQSLFDDQDDTNVIIFEDLNYFVKEQNRKSSIENTPTLARLSARYSSSNVAVAYLQPKLDRQNNDSVSSKVKLKHLGRLLDARVPFRCSPPGSIVTTAKTSEIDDASDDAVRGWIKEHGEFQPLVGICSKRTRFKAVGKNHVQSMWAVLDRDISMTGVKQEDLSNSGSPLNLRTGSQHFPHAVLQIRQLDENDDFLLRKLDQSHLLERIRGFSIDVQAIWCCCKPPDMQAPHWIPRLSQDIRKIPGSNDEPRRINGSIHISSADRTSISTPSASGPEAPDSSDTAVSIPKTGHSYAAARLREVAANRSRQQTRKAFGKSKQSAEGLPDQRYWNEYDDPEGGGDDAYVIWVDPNSGTSFKKWFGKLLPSWNRPSSAETKSLLSTGNTPTEDDLPDDSSSTSDESPIEQRKSSPYGTFNPFNSYAHGAPLTRPNFLSRVFPSRRNERFAFGARSQSRFRPSNARPRASAGPNLERVSTPLERYEQTRTLLTLLTFSASTAILAVIGVLAATGRHKQVYEVDAGIVFGIVVNLLFACVGLGCLVSSHGTRWVAWCCGLMLFGAICVGNGGLCAWLVT